MSDEHSVQISYDEVAEEYATRIYHELQHKPFDRALLDRFGEVVGPAGPICDLGCGPGHVARYLHDRGLAVVGVDISSQMIEQARLLNPDIEFRRGSMLDLPFQDELLFGIAAFYSIIHIPRDRLVQAFSEMRRVLRPGGSLLVSFHLGDQDRHLDEWWGKMVSIDFYFFTAQEVAERIAEAGLVVDETLQRPPYPEVEVETRRAYILARRPG